MRPGKPGNEAIDALTSLLSLHIHIKIVNLTSYIQPKCTLEANLLPKRGYWSGIQML